MSPDPTNPLAEPTLSVERIDAIIAEGNLDLDEIVPLAKQARRCAVAEATLKQHDSWCGDCVVERDKLRERVKELEADTAGNLLTRLAATRNTGNIIGILPGWHDDRRFKAACAAMAALQANPNNRSTAEQDAETAWGSADALLNHPLATPPALAAGEDGK